MVGFSIFPRILSISLFIYLALLTKSYHVVPTHMAYNHNDILVIPRDTFSLHFFVSYRNLLSPHCCYIRHTYTYLASNLLDCVKESDDIGNK